MSIAKRLGKTALKLFGTKKAGRRNLPKIVKGRPAFKFRTGESIVKLVNFRGRKCMLRVGLGFAQESKRFARKTFIQQKIFHELFPENSITPIGIAQTKIGEEKMWGMVSEILKNRSNNYKVYQKFHYGQIKEREMTEAQKMAVQGHEIFVKAKAQPLANEIEQKTGIALDKENVNICNVNEKPVFFELYRAKMDTDKLRQYINSIVQNQAKKTRLLKYVSLWESTTVSL